MAVSIDSLQDKTKAQRRAMVGGVLLIAILVHVLAGIGAAVWIVARALAQPEATFVAQKIVTLPPKIIDPRMAASELEAAAPKPTFDDKIASLRETDFALPDLPPMPMDRLMDFDPSTIMSDQISSMATAAGAGGGDGGLGGGGGLGDTMNFLGIQTTGRRIVLMYDISTTVVNSAARAGIPFERIREETLKMLEGLSINSRFALVQFARNYAFFQPELLPATDANREKAREWLNQWFAVEGSMKQNTPRMVRGSPGFLVVLEEVFKMNPDVVFIVSDAKFWRAKPGSESGERIPYDEINKFIREQQRNRPEPVKIHFIGVGIPKDVAREIRKWVRPGGGVVREVE